MNRANSWEEYIYQLHNYIRDQDKRIKDLEERINQLESNNNKGNQTTIEKLEYHFDQLKIERLDGTLHIGLSPEELGVTDDFSINQNRNQVQGQVINQLQAYLNEQGPSLLHQLANKYGHPPNQINQQILLDDVRKQLPERVAHYEKYARDHRVTQSEYELSQYIFEQVQKEINHSLSEYFTRSDES